VTKNRALAGSKRIAVVKVVNSKRTSSITSLQLTGCRTVKKHFRYVCWHKTHAMVQWTALM